jgi:hypothetical protein
LSKFIQTIDSDGDPVIINLEAITHIEKAFLGLTIYFQPDCLVALKGESADIFWEFITEASWQINQQPQEEDKK